MMGGFIVIIQQQEGCNAHETQGMNFIVSTSDIIEVHVLEVKATSEAILLKHLSGAKLAKEDQNKKKTHELVLMVQPKAKINMAIDTFMKVKSLGNQCTLTLFTMPLTTIYIGDACEYLFLGC
jgi:hypothetical protein